MDSFFLMGAKPLVQDSPTMKLHELLDWDEIAHKLKGLYKATHGGGPEPRPLHDCPQSEYRKPSRAGISRCAIEIEFSGRF
ncbi:hypothetical protein [Pelomonas sp. Root1237]|uniref:hypothetical protein n=1 Tax=Pelomonas sp. Root1237 TaxID=1736434 RepID=UPI0006FA9472|nr:hypothetical protein [Pelomonas sp. Root1237]KQV89385.1 hypothetical protein ASC91_12340 [Pelomonas sp. Root1237]